MFIIKRQAKQVKNKQINKDGLLFLFKLMQPHIFWKNPLYSHRNKTMHPKAALPCKIQGKAALSLPLLPIQTGTEVLFIKHTTVPA